MFDFAWSEIALIGVVALIAIGPKDMPVAIKAISDTVKKLRRMAGEFQGHVDEMLRDADLKDVKSSIDELRSLNPRAMVQRAIDPDGTVRAAFADPFRDNPVRPVTPQMTAQTAPKLDQGFVAPPQESAAADQAALPQETGPHATVPVGAVHIEAAPVEAARAEAATPLPPGQD